MTSKVIQTITGNQIEYKVIKDGYKTISQTIDVTESLPTRGVYNLEPSTIVHDPELDYTVDTSHTYPPVITFNENVVTPDDKEITTNKYIFAPYGQDYLAMEGQQEDNFSRVGNVQVSKDGIANGFSRVDYLKTSLNALNSVWDIYLKFTTPSSTVTGGQKILSIGTRDSEYKYGLIFINNAGTNIYVKTSNDGSNYILTGVNSSNIINGGTYYIRFGCDGTKSYAYISTTGYESMTLLEEVNTVSTIPTEDFYLGYGPDSQSKGAFVGSIDLSESYIKVNGKIIWQPTWNRLPLNYISIGDIEVNNNGVAKNFSASNYIKILGFQPESFPWKITTQIYVNQWVTGSAILGQNGEYSVPQLYIGNLGYLQLWLSSNGSSWDIASNVTASRTISTNTWHTLVLEFTGTSYRVLVDNITYITVTSSTKIYRNYEPLCLGFDEDGYFRGNIWLKNTTVTYGNSTDNTFTWKYRSTNKLNCELVGNPIILDNQYLSKPDTSNYLKKPEVFNPGNTPWEVGLKFKSGTDFSKFQMLFHSCPNSSNRYGICLGLDKEDSSKSRLLNFYCSGDGSSWIFDEYGTVAIQNNTEYWVKIGWTGQVYYMDTSTDGIQYNREITYNSTTPAYSNLTLTNFGVNIPSSNSFTGVLDFSNIYIKINEDITWKGSEKFADYLPGILDSSIEDTGDPITLNLYDVETTKRSLILNNNRNVTVTGKQFVQYDGQVTVPDHGLSLYNEDSQTWTKYRFITLEVDDPDTTLYVTGNID